MRRTYFSFLLFFCFLFTVHAEDGFDVAAIVWPAYHPEPRWKELGIFEHGTGEWQNVYQAESKRDGHMQPIIPLWGYGDESDPIVVARRIDAALAAGINVFMYDWYWYCGRPFLEDALNDGFLKAPNNKRAKFFIMWANHDVNGLWDKKVGTRSGKHNIKWSADVSYEEFTQKIVPRWIKYFREPNYYKITGKPVLAIFELKNMIRGMGGDPEKARDAFEYLRKECVKAGFSGLHLMSMHWGGPSAAKISGSENPTPKQVAEYYGFDSMTTYNWNGSREGGYEKWGENSMSLWDSYKKDFGTFFPIVSTGWDNNPRYPADEFTPVVEGKSPEAYERMLRKAKSWAERNIPAGSPKLLIINAWNEWTEGEYLEPDERFGYGFLNATARVFGAHGQSKF